MHTPPASHEPLIGWLVRAARHLLDQEQSGIAADATADGERAGGPFALMRDPGGPVAVDSSAAVPLAHGTPDDG